MGGGRHRDAVSRDVDAGLQAVLVDVGEPPAHHVGVQVPHVEEQVVAFLLLHHLDHPGHHYVARRQLSQRVYSVHHPVAFLVHQERPLAADRLADQELGLLGGVQGGRVELHELDVAHPRAGAERHRQTVAGADRRVGGDQVDLPHAPQGDDRRFGPGDHQRILPAVDHQDTTAGASGLQQVDDERVLHHLHPRLAGQRPAQGVLDLRPGRVAPGVNDPPVGVPALLGEVELPCAHVEVGVVDLQQLAYPVGTLVHQDSASLGVREARPGHQSVVDVRLLGVVGIHHRGDPPLGVAGGGDPQVRLGDQQHVAELGKVKCGRQAGYAAARDHDVAGHRRQGRSVEGEQVSRDHPRASILSTAPSALTLISSGTVTLGSRVCSAQSTLDRVVSFMLGHSGSAAGEKKLFSGAALASG